MMKPAGGSYRYMILLILALIAMIAGCAGHGDRGIPAAAPGPLSGLSSGYLPAKSVPNSLLLLPPPPAAGSAAFALDEEASRRSFLFHDTPRWLLAGSDADLSFPHAAGTFSCALNTPITEEDTPHLYTLLRRTLTDAVLSTYAAKNHYRRTRPFLINEGPICLADERIRPWLGKNGSYPSGHTAIGWTWALILCEIAPERIDAILARGRAFGESRIVCNAHWQSDVTEGLLVGAGTVARLHADPAFRADLEAARAELAAVRARGLKPTRDCDAEAAAIALQPPAGR